MEHPNRTFISDEQKAILVEMSQPEERPMENRRDKMILAEATARTNLPLECVKNWIGNFKKGPDRGKRKKVNTDSLTEWTAFLRMSNEDNHGNPQLIGEFSSKKSESYRKLKKTKAGRKILSDNLHEQKHIDLENFTTQQLHNRALAMYDRIEKEIGRLDNIGYKATTMIAQPEGPPAVLGPVAGVAYLRNRQDVVSDYAEHMAGNRMTNDKREALRFKIQDGLK